MGLDVRNPVFGVSDKPRLKPVSLATETSKKIRKNACSKSKKEGKDQKSIQSSTTPEPGYQLESDNTNESLYYNTFQ